MVRLMASNGDAGHASNFPANELFAKLALYKAYEALRIDRLFVLPARSPRFHRGGPGAAPGQATIFRGISLLVERLVANEDRAERNRHAAPADPDA